MTPRKPERSSVGVRWWSGARIWIVLFLLFAAYPASVGRQSTVFAYDRAEGGTQVSLNSTFANNRAGAWPVGAFGPSAAHVSNGRLVVSTTGGHVYVEAPKHVPLIGDGTLTATFRATGQGSWRVGIAARWSRLGSRFGGYDYWIDNQGYIGATEWTPAGKERLVFNLLVGTSSNTKDVTLTLSAKGSDIRFLLNGQEINSDTSGPQPPGAWGAYVAGIDSGGTAQGLYSHIMLAGTIAVPAPRATFTPTRTPPRPTATQTPRPAATHTPTATPTRIAPKPTATPTATPQPTLAPGTVWSWGGNAEGELGVGNHAASRVPLRTHGLQDVRAISARFDHGMALTRAGMVWTWGANDSGQLGNGTTANSSTPVQVHGLTNIVEIAAGAGHSLALRGDGTVWAWGSDANGQLGNGAVGNGSDAPIQVNGLRSVVAIAAGDGFSVALKRDGTVWAWGSNTNGELGTGTTTDTNSPTQVSGLGNVRSIVAGTGHALALKGDGTLWAWGANDSGQLGNGGAADSSTPIEVKGLGGVQAMAVGNGFSLAVTIDGAVWGWGAGDNGELGNGGTVDSATPSQVKNLAAIRSVSAGDAFGMALGRDGSVWSWGANDNGQLGIGSTAGSRTPRRIPGLAKVQAIAAGSLYGLALVK